MHSPEPVLHAQNAPVSQCWFLLHSAAAAPATQARARAATLMLCLDCLSFCYAAGLVEGLPPVGEALLRYYQLPLTREVRYKLVLRAAQQSPRSWVRVREHPHQSLEELPTFAFRRPSTIL